VHRTHIVSLDIVTMDFLRVSAEKNEEYL